MRICITGGAGYVGSELTQKLLQEGHHVTVLDRFWFGEDVFGAYKKHARLDTIHGDIRWFESLKAAFKKQDCVMHLACISNDPSFEMDPALGKEVNLDSFPLILRALKECKVPHFIYASSSSVYGVKKIKHVHEDVPCEPLTDYSKYKLECENMLKKADMGDMVWTILRPATVCGFSNRLRLDLVVNIFAAHAMVNKKIIVHGGSQMRPNINIKDMVLAYVHMLHCPKDYLDRETFNVSFGNFSLHELAELVKTSLGDPSVQIEYQDSKDPRSYHILGTRIKTRTGFKARNSLNRAVGSLAVAYGQGNILEPLTNPLYYNIKRMGDLKHEGRL